MAQMDTEASRPHTKKEQLIRDRLGRLEIKYRREFAFRLLTGQPGLPGHWLKQSQRAFVELETESTVDPAVRDDGLDLTDRVVSLCELVYRLIDDFVGRDRTLDQKERASLRQGRGPGAVCEVLFGSYETWPPAEPRDLREAVRSTIDEVLRETARPRREARHSEPSPAPPMPRNEFELAAWHKTRATVDDDSLRRHRAYDDAEDRHLLVRVGAGAVVAMAFAAAYVAMFLTLQYLAPNLTAHEDMLVAGAAVTTTVGPTSVVLAGALFSAQRLRRRGRTGGRSDDAE
jgi:hypothetical protein